MTDEDKHRFKRQAHVANQADEQGTETMKPTAQQQVQVAQDAVRAMHESLDKHGDKVSLGTMFVIASAVLVGIEHASGIPRERILKLADIAMSAHVKDLAEADADEGSDT